MSSKPRGWTGLSGEWVSEGCYYCRRRIICWLYLYQGFFFIGTLYWVFLQSLFPVSFGWLCCFFTVKPIVGVNDRRGKNPFQSSSPPLMRKYRQVQTQFPFSIYRAAYSAVSPFFKCSTANVTIPFWMQRGESVRVALGQGEGSGEESVPPAAALQTCSESRNH